MQGILYYVLYYNILFFLILCFNLSNIKHDINSMQYVKYVTLTTNARWSPCSCFSWYLVRGSISARRSAGNEPTTETIPQAAANAVFTGRSPYFNPHRHPCKQIWSTTKTMSFLYQHHLVRVFGRNIVQTSCRLSATLFQPSSCR